MPGARVPIPLLPRGYMKNSPHDSHTNGGIDTTTEAAAAAAAVDSVVTTTTNSGMLSQQKMKSGRSSSLFSVRVLQGIQNINPKQTLSVTVNFESGTLYVGETIINMSAISQVHCQGDSGVELHCSTTSESDDVKSPVCLVMENTGQRRELCIYIRLFQPNATFLDSNEMEREDGVVVFKAAAPFGMMHRMLACLFIVHPKAGTVTFVPGENEKSSKKKCFIITKATQIVYKKKQIILAFSSKVEPVTAVFQCSYQCLRFAAWVHREWCLQNLLCWAICVGYVLAIKYVLYNYYQAQSIFLHIY